MNKRSILILLILLSFFNSKCKQDSISPDGKNSIDTTSHYFTWQIDTIGMYSSYLHGIWGSDVNNVYAVGLVLYSLNPFASSSIIRWDGVKWNPTDNLEGDFNGIYGFSENDIWVVGAWWVTNSPKLVISHWNGQKWATWKTKQYDQLFAIWGTSSKNLFAVGMNGLVLHFDGSSWTRQESPTSMQLRDVWGFDENHIYAAGYDDRKGEGILLQYDNFNWKTIARGGEPDSVILYGQFHSVWGDVNKLMLVGAISYEGKINNWKLSDIPYNSPGDNIVGLSSMNLIRGSS